MTLDARFLNTKEAAQHIGKTYRWMQRHYVDLIRNGVKVLRMPKGASRGHLAFEKESLERYLKICQLEDKVLDIG